MSGFLLFAYTAEVQAKKPKITPAAEVLPPGGKTIGGPAYWNGRLEHWGGYVVYGGPSANICVTIVNVGPNWIKMGPTPAGGDLVFPSDTQTRCLENTDQFRLACETGEETCKGYWRIDSM